jgi:DNA-binding NarL/FixJ family response regulator
MTVDADHTPGQDDERPRMPRLLIADDEAFMHSVLKAQLSEHFDIIGAALDADEAIALAALHQPEVAIIDVRMPGGGGLRATREIQQHSPQTAIVALSTDESMPVVLEMLQAGAMKYLHKGMTGKELTRTLHSAIAAHATLLADYGGRTNPTLLIADDEPFMQSVLHTQLCNEFDIVGGALDADQAIALAELHQPDVAIIDVQMPGGGGLRAAREIRERAPNTAIVALSTDESVPIVLSMLQAGAMKYLHKGTTGAELTGILRSAKAAHGKMLAQR